VAWVAFGVTGSNAQLDVEEPELDELELVAPELDELELETPELDKLELGARELEELVRVAPELDELELGAPELDELERDELELDGPKLMALEPVEPEPEELELVEAEVEVLGVELDEPGLDELELDVLVALPELRTDAVLELVGLREEPVELANAIEPVLDGLLELTENIPPAPPWAPVSALEHATENIVRSETETRRTAGRLWLSQGTRL
jgi:hypothetical protein